MTPLKHRYRMTQMNLIPKFGSGWQAQVAPEFVAGRGGVAAPAATPAVGRQSGARWRRALALFGGWLGSRPAARGVHVAPMPDRRPSQPELHLESVRPLRNDLSDSDFEVRVVQPVRAARESGLLASAGGALNRAKNLLH